MLKFLLSRRSWKFWLPVVLLICLKITYQRVSYPVSDQVINPITGKYDADLEAWIEPITWESGDAVTIDLGDRAGVADSIEKDVLFVLSPVIRMHPRARVFTVGWEMVCCTDGGTSDGSQELIYNRETGQVSYHSTGFAMGVSYDTTKIIAQGITDLSIHRLAASPQGGYSQLGR